LQVDAEKIVEDDINEIVEDIHEHSKEFENKRILLVGGRGFLGTYFLKTLLKLNDGFSKPAKIVVLDNLITAKDKEKIDNPSVEFHQADVSEKFEVNGDFDFVIPVVSPTYPEPITPIFMILSLNTNYKPVSNLLLGLS